MKQKLLLALLALFTLGGSASATDYVTNGGNLVYTCRVNGSPTTADVKESWCDNASQAFDLSQELTNLPAGIYTMSLQAMYRASLNSGTPTNCVVYATTNGSYYEAPLANFGDYNADESLSGVTTAMETDANYLNIVPYFIVTEDYASVRLGARSIDALTRCTNGYWFIWKTSSFKVSDVSDTNILAQALADVKAEVLRILNAAEDSQEKRELQSLYDNAEATSASIVALKKAIKTYAGQLGSANNPVDVTPIYVNNGNFTHGIAFNNGNTNAVNLAPMGWTTSDDGNGVYNYLSIVKNNETYDSQSNFAYEGKTVGYSLYMRHAWSDNVLISAKQIISNLPNGRYKVSVPAKKTGNTANVKFTFGGETDNNNVETSWKVYDKTFVVDDTNKEIEIELSYKHGSGGGQRAFFDGVTLIAYGDPLKAVKTELTAIQTEASELLNEANYENVKGTERSTLTALASAQPEEETVNAYQTVITNLQNAITAFIAAKPSYDALAAEITYAKSIGVAETTANGYAATETSTAATAVTSTENLKVDEYIYVVSEYPQDFTSTYMSSPTSNTFNTASGQHWSGNGSYYDKWSGSSADCQITYNMTLPAGKYIVKAAGRGQVDSPSTLSMTDGTNAISFLMKGDTGLGINKEGDASFNPGDSKGFANEGLGRGWEWRYLLLDLSEEQAVTITLNGHVSNSWVGAYNFALLTTESNAAINKAAWEEALAAAVAAFNNADYANVTGKEKDDLQAEIDKAEPQTRQDYDEAAESLRNATNAFTEAKTFYDAYVAEKVNGERIDATITSDIAAPTTAAEADAAFKTILVNEYNYVKNNFNADAAETYEMTIDKWTPTATSGGNSDTPQTNSNQKWGETATTYYEQGRNGWGSNAWTLNYTITKNLPAGTYVLRIAARASAGTTATLKAIVGENTITEPLPNYGSEGKGITTAGVASFDEGEFANEDKGYGWQWRYLAVTLSDASDVTFQIDAYANTNQQWCSFGDVAVISNVDLTALTTVYNNFTMKTLGFQKDEYAPYTNAALLQAYADAKAIVKNTAKPEDQAQVNALTTTLTAAEWVKNEEDLDAIYNGNFAVANGTNPKGWTRSNNGWGQQITGLTAENGVNEGTSTAWYYNNNGAWQYGNDGVYTMPLAANQTYVLSFKYSKHGNDWQTSMTASVTNTDNQNQGLKVAQFPGADNSTTFQSVKAYFTTGAAGNYILSIEQNGNAHLTDVSLVKAESATKNFDEASTTYTPELAYYETVSLTRSLQAGDKWNTFCVPFDMVIPEGWTVKEFDSAENNTINFKNAESIVAGKPYIVKLTEAVTNPTYSNVVVKSTEGETMGQGDYKFAAQIFNKSLATDGSIAYMTTSGQIKKLTSGGIKGLRAYFIIPANGESARIHFVEEDETTGIDAIDGVIVENGNIYDLQGRKVETMKRGIYIVNGKKVVIK